MKIPVVSSFLLKVMKKKKVEKKHDEQVDEGNRKSIEEKERKEYLIRIIEKRKMMKKTCKKMKERERENISKR